MDEVEENGEFVEEEKVDQNKILSEGHGELDHLVLHVQQDHGVGGVAGGQEQAASNVTENISMEVHSSLEPLVHLEDNISGAKLGRSDSVSSVPSQMIKVPSPDDKINTSDELSGAKVAKTNTGSATCSVLGLTSPKRARKVAGSSSLLSDSQATSKAELSLDSQVTSGDGMSLDSRATSKAGLSLDSQGSGSAGASQEPGMRLTGESKDSETESAGGSQARQIYPYKWFDIAIEDGTENGGGRVMFWNLKKSLFAVEDYFLLKEERCSLSHNCAGRVKGVRLDMMDNVLILNEPSDKDSMSIANLLTHVDDGCVIDTGHGEIQGGEGVTLKVPLR